MLKVEQLEDRNKIIYIAFAILVLHFLVAVSVLPKVDFKSLTQTDKPSPLRLRIISKAAQQIVQTNKSKELLDVKKKFLGKTESTFTRETIARNTGVFNTAGKGIKEAQDQQDSSAVVKSKKVSLSDISKAAQASFQKTIEKKSQVARVKKGIKRGVASSRGLSRSSDFVNDIPLGDFTRLNTQEFKFYGFYHRIRQKLEQFWGRNIQEQADKIIKSGRSIASGSNHVTALQIELNDRGEIVNVKVKANSGVRELDKTAVRTFNDAGPFPNPPKKMLKNGRVVINWSFVVKT